MLYFLALVHSTLILVHSTLMVLLVEIVEALLPVSAVPLPPPPRLASNPLNQLFAELLD